MANVIVYGHGRILGATFLVPANCHIHFFGPPGGAMAGGLADDKAQGVEPLDWEPRGIELRRDYRGKSMAESGAAKNVGDGQLDGYPIVYHGGEQVLDHSCSDGDGLERPAGAWLEGSPHAQIRAPCLLSAIVNFFTGPMAAHGANGYDFYWLMCRSDSKLRHTRSLGNSMKDDDHDWWRKGGGTGTKVF